MKIGHSSTDTISFPEWDGCKPTKFRGGRSHNNHPPDELDNLLISCRSDPTRPLGPSRRHY